MGTQRVEGKLTAYHPLYYGTPTQFGFGRDWVIDEFWTGLNTEVISPLKALSPVANRQPANIGAWSTWTVVGGPTPREVIISGNPPCRWLEYGDGAVHDSGDLPGCLLRLVSVEFRAPNFGLHLVRQSPPPGQGIFTQVIMAVACEQRIAGVWTAGTLNLVLPLASASYPQPFLHVIAPNPGGYYDVLGEGDIISLGEVGAQGAQLGPGRESWFFEYVPPPATAPYTAGWILIRNSTDMARWWMYHHDDIRLPATTNVAVTVGGAVTQFNVTPLGYGAYGGMACKARAYFPQDLPASDGSAWNAGGTWGGIATAATGWTVAVDDAPGVEYRPEVTFTPTGAPLGVRPVVWLVTEDHPTVLGMATTGSETSVGKKLKRLTLSMNADWVGAQATAEFYEQATPALSDTYWREDALVDVELGWETGTAWQRQAVWSGFIMPGGIRRVTQGGKTQVTLELGDLAATRLSASDMVDMRQAGGQTVGSWLQEIGRRVGLPSAVVYLQSPVDTWIIPVGKPPSEPSQVADDGGDYVAHNNEVARAAGIRVGYNTPFGLLAADRGMGAYWPGTSTHAMTISKAGLDDSMAAVISREASGEGHRNAFKVVAGERGWLRQVAYHCEALTQRVARGMMPRWRHRALSDDGDTRAGETAQAYGEYWRGVVETVRVRTLLRPDVRPEMFILVQDAQDCGLVAGAVLQVRELTHEVDGDSNEGTSDFVCAVVYLPGVRAAGTLGNAAIGSRGLGG